MSCLGTSQKTTSWTFRACFRYSDISHGGANLSEGPGGWNTTPRLGAWIILGYETLVMINPLWYRGPRGGVVWLIGDSGIALANVSIARVEACVCALAV